MTDDEWSELEQEWVDLVRVRGAAEASWRYVELARAEMQKALDGLERARKRAERARAKLTAACATSEEWTRFAAACCDASELIQ